MARKPKLPPGMLRRVPLALPVLRATRNDWPRDLIQQRVGTLKVARKPFSEWFEQIEVPAEHHGAPTGRASGTQDDSVSGRARK